MLPFDKKMQRFTDWSAEFDARVTASKVRQGSLDRGKDLNMSNVFKKD
jgi:hypothetical protein